MVRCVFGVACTITRHSLDYTADCGYPELLSTVNGNDSVPNIVGFNDIIPVEGTTVAFSCPPGLVLNGFNLATCTENGEWAPDPSRLTCNDSIGKNLHYYIDP